MYWNVQDALYKPNGNSGTAKAFSLIEHAVSRSHPPAEINDNLK